MQTAKASRARAGGAHSLDVEPETTMHVMPAPLACRVHVQRLDGPRLCTASSRSGTLDCCCIRAQQASKDLTGVPSSATARAGYSMLEARISRHTSLEIALQHACAHEDPDGEANYQRPRQPSWPLLRPHGPYLAHDRTHQ